MERLKLRRLGDLPTQRETSAESEAMAGGRSAGGVDAA